MYYVSVTIFSATAGELANFQIQRFDEIGNQHTISPALVLSLLKLSDVNGTNTSSCQFNPEKTLSSYLQRTSNTSAFVTYTYNLSGPVALQGIVFQPGGLSLQIYDSPHVDGFSIIQGSSSPVYSSVDMNFGSARIDFNYATLYSSVTTKIVWRGFLVPSFTESYSFQLSSNGCTSVSISGKVMFTCSNVTANSVKLRANELHPVEISFLPSNGEPFLVLFWQSNSQQREIIPSSRW